MKSQWICPKNRTNAVLLKEKLKSLKKIYHRSLLSINILKTDEETGSIKEIASTRKVYKIFFSYNFMRFR